MAVIGGEKKRETNAMKKGNFHNTIGEEKKLAGVKKKGEKRKQNR